MRKFINIIDKAMLNESSVEEGISWVQKGHNDFQPTGNLPDHSMDDVAQMRSQAAERVAAKRLAAKQTAIAKLIHDGLENYSGIEHGGEETAAHDIIQLAEPTHGSILAIIQSVDSYNPYEGFEASSIETVTQDICNLLGIMR